MMHIFTTPNQGTSTNIVDRMMDELKTYDSFVTTEVSSVPSYNHSPEYDCCRACQNNPRVNPHASGICNCSLPSMSILY